MKTILLGHDALGRPVELSGQERETHMHVIGSSGSGKSKFLEQMMRGDLDNRQGFCLIDPHGSLYQDVLHYCSHKVLSREIVLLNLSEPAQVIGFNCFGRSRAALHDHLCPLVHDQHRHASVHQDLRCLTAQE